MFITFIVCRMKKRVGIVIGGAGDSAKPLPTSGTNTNTSQLNTSISGFCSVDEGVDLLAGRMSKLDSRIADIEQKDMAARVSDRGSSRGRGGRSRSVKERQLDEDSCDSLGLLRSIEQLERRVDEHDDALDRLARKTRGRSSSRGRRNDSDDDRHRHSRSRSTQRRTYGEDEDMNRVKHDVRSLQKKVKTLGESTSRACRSLSVGVTDSQNASLQLYAWADKVHSAFAVVSKDCLQRSKNICPRAKLADLSNPKASPASRSGKGARRSASAGPEGRNREGGVESDYEITF